MDFAVLKIASTRHNSRYASATDSMFIVLLVRSTCNPSNRASSAIRAASISKCPSCGVARNRRYPALPTSSLSPAFSLLRRLATVASGATACLSGIETNHVATRLRPRPPVAGDHLLDLDVDLAATRSRNGQRHHRLAIGQHDFPHFGRAALAGAEDVVDAACLEFGDRVGTDHAAIGDHAHVADAEAIAQPGDDRQQ